MPTSEVGKPAQNRVWTLDAVTVATAMLAVAGVAMRLWLVLSPLGPPDADESVVGLMARHLLHGQFVTFFWGQPYGGSHEAVLVATLLAVGIPMRWAMELVPFALAAVAAVLVGVLGTEVLDRRAGLLAGGLFWCSSPAFLWSSTKERGYYGVMVVVGVAVLLCVARLSQETSLRTVAVLGVAAGTGWWISPQIIYIAMPAALALLWHLVRSRDTRLARLLPVAAATAVVAALPWFVTNLRTGWASMVPLTTLPHTTLRWRFGLFRTMGLPIAAGAKVPLRDDWLGGGVGKIAFVALLAVLLFALVKMPSRALVVKLTMVVYPLIFTALPTSFYVRDPRYLALLWPAVAIAVAFVATQVRWSGVAVVLAAGVIVTTSVGLRAFADFAQSSPAFLDTVPGDLAPVQAALRARHVDRLYADYWLAQRLTLFSNEKVIAAPLQFVRHPAYDRAVAASRTHTYVVAAGTCSEREFLARLDGNAVQYTTQPIDRWTLVTLDRYVAPGDALPDWRSARTGETDHVC